MVERERYTATMNTSDHDPKQGPYNPRSAPQYRLGGGMLVAMWLLVLGLLTYAFSVWLDHAHNPNRHAESLVRADGSHEVILQRNRYGNYVASGTINGQRVTFMLDTGASDISIPSKIAERLGLQRGPEQGYQTAAGPVVNYLTRLDRIAIGNIVLHNVRASINPNVDDDQVLLGMNFLGQLQITQRGNTLTLRQ